MKKQYLIGIAILLLVAAGCNKSSMFKGSEPVHLDDAKTLTFKVSAQGIQAVKSHFASDASEIAGEEASLEWDETDKTGVIAVPYNPEMGDYDFDLVADEAHVCIAAYQGLDENGKAVFASTEDNPSWWAAKATEIGDSRDYTTDESLYGFFAYYPANEKTPFKLRAENLDVYSQEEEGIIVDHVYAPMSHIPWAQDGVNYNNYHILYDTSHIPVIGTIDTGVLVSAADLKNNVPVNFDSFRPVNAMLRFKVSKTADSTIESIDSLRVTVKSDFWNDGGGEDGFGLTYKGTWAKVSYYYNSSYLTTVGISGTAIPPLMFSKQCQDHLKKLYIEDEGEDGWEDYEELMNRAVVSANSNLIPYMSGLYVGDVKTNSSVSVQFTSPLQVSTADSDYYYMVVYPTFNVIFDDDNRCCATFEAFSGGKRVMMAEKIYLETGFLPGYRYNFKVTLGEGVVLEGANAGSYELVDEIELAK